jgi:excisionase family DNA binding protein
MIPNGFIMNDMPRFLTLPDVAEILNVNLPQVRALVRSGDLKGIQVGGRGVWRVEDVELEAYIKRAYAETEKRIHAGAEVED